MDEETDWRRKWERLKHWGSTISPQAVVHLGHMPWALTERRRRRRRAVFMKYGYYLLRYDFYVTLHLF
jgi:hypothetical protein